VVNGNGGDSHNRPLVHSRYLTQTHTLYTRLSSIRLDSWPVPCAPVDSHHIDEIKGYAKTATETHAALEKQGVHVTRNRPDLLW
jgi:hypothetical protein